ncbi:lysylphosphatidylglycerol synthase transmembrane domain-containing protein [Nocardioides mangrovi]|uniref:Flippase-like domain-containing protein n=1 Tax=Nocardioides mangrovi TaxID=2874580 RepID=A0ABS7UGT7_9ACTN|nr:lysylphosphatidylglycerol synthase transmembrane domain-containing protein [Nocardioides mangrovi]MBZ5740015.1 flippase-like domain-containing protein [Nocardioides mangrovi]MBZ5740814.1 flippase-like domain-containing protein [Nocardioides mangrovi]
MAEPVVPARFFVRGANLSRRPVDLTLLVVGVLVALSCVRAAVDRGSLDSAVRHVADDLPRWVTTLFDISYALGTVYVGLVAVAVVLTLPRRGRLPITLVVAVGIAIGATLVASLLAGAGLPELDPGPVRAGSPHGFPTLRVAMVTAALLALRPWVVLSYRRLHVLVVSVQCVAAWAIGIAGPTDVLGALAIGVAGASAALILFGSPAGHPELGQVTGSLRGLGLELTDLRFAEEQPWGARLLLATAPDGAPVLVKVYGRDATDAHRAARWWRMLLYRDQTAPQATRLQLVEHEALVTILADRALVGVDDVLAAAESDGDAIIVLGAPAEPLSGVPEVDDATLRSVWETVGRLHGAGLTHGGLTLDRVAATERGVVLSGFADGTVAAGDAERAQELATLLTAVAHQVGPDRAVDGAVEVLGAAPVAAAVPYLQRAALPRPLRSADGMKQLLGDLQTTVVDRTGTEPPPPAEITRVSWGGLLQTALILVAAYALLSTLVGLDWATVWDTWRNATWAWVVIGLVIAQVTSVADSVTTMSAVTTRLPLLPLVQLQYAIKTVGLAISATVGRVALNTSLFRRYGEGPAAAVTASALDSFAGALCNVLVVAVGLLFAQSLPDFALSSPTDLGKIVLALAVAVGISVVVVAAVPKLRARVVLVVRSGWEALSVVTQSPTRALVLVGSNLASLLITAVAMACMVEGLQPSLPYTQVLFVTAAAALFASIIPVPGNVGVGEAAIAAGLVAMGMDSGPAFAIAVTQRIATSYLPPVYGAWALRWLRREDYVD